MSLADSSLTWEDRYSEAGGRGNVRPASDPPVRVLGKGAAAIMAHARKFVTPNSGTNRGDR